MRNRPAAWRRFAVAWLGVLALGTATGDTLTRGDDAWQRRADGASDGRPVPAPVLDSVRAYEDVLEREPASLEARWKLLRSLHFAAEFAVLASTERRRILERGREAAERGLDQIASALEPSGRLDEREPGALRELPPGLPRDDVARLHFWAAIHWGAWSREAGLLAAVREGVANRIHRYVQVALALEPEYDAGAPFRLLGRLHAELPSVPFVSGWVDRDRAIPLIERAYEIAPEHPGNRLLLAMTLLELAPARRPEALDLLESVEDLTPRESMRIEDLAIRREASARLREARG